MKFANKINLTRTFLCLLICFSRIAFSQTSSGASDSSIVVKKTSDFEVDGKGSADNWNSTSWVLLPERTGTTPGYETQIKILYSDSGIYCMFKSGDKKITSTLREDFLNIWTEDVVEVFFWPDEQATIYFEYELSPFNYELPILVPNFKGDFLGWRPWHYEGTRRTRHGAHIQKNESGEPLYWIAEFYIPFALLKPLQNVPAKKNTRWRANFYRMDHDKGLSRWSWRVTRKNFHDYEKFGTIVFE